jgi:hypothetical protein
MARRAHSIVLLLAIGPAAFGARSVPAQNAASHAGIVGRIVDLQSRSPIRDAHIALLGTPLRAATDSGGRFAVDSLRSGTYVLQARATGYEVTSWVIPLHDGELLEQAFALPPIVDTLAPITVEGRPTFFQQRMREFNERRQTGRGVFLTEEEIHERRAATLVDVLRGVPGVRLSCRVGTCVVEMTRSAQGICRADWVVDGFPATESGTPHLPVVGIVGIEIYRSAGETPPQFLKADSQCGVIVIWTKSGP